MIEIKNISKMIQGKEVLENVTLNIEKDRILALIGPSGCGKTTLLRLVAGFEVPDEGSITIDGIQVGGSNYVLPPRKRQLAMIFQDLALWPHMTALQHLEYVIRQKKHQNNNFADKISSLLDAVNLNGHSDRYPHQLSGGEQQRLAIVRALAQDPKYLLMDEPFSNLDPILKEELELFISRIQSESAIGIVYVTHNIKDLERITDQIAVMQNGRLIQIGNKEDVFRNPANRFVEKILGI
ncbi:MAG: ABC transporter ATP-binding protein [Desulfobacterales bacterium]|nr:ABC transporter ATP-binding protein [Desulfobacterales bacterium]